MRKASSCLISVFLALSPLLSWGEHNAYTLSASQPRIVIPIGELVDATGAQSVTLTQNSASELPQLYTRTATDDPSGSGVRHGQISATAICLTEDSGSAGSTQTITVTYESAVAGEVYISVHAALPYDSPYWQIGAFTSTPTGNDTQRRSLRVASNSTTATGINVVGASHGQATDRPFQWLGANTFSASTAKAFPVNVGMNTITLACDVNGHGAGILIDAVAIDFERGDGIPSAPDAFGVQTCRDVARHGFDRYNTAAAADLIKQANQRPVGVMIVGSSLTVRGDNWAVTARKSLEATYGKAGIIQRAAVGGSSTLGVDLPTGTTSSDWIGGTGEGMVTATGSGGSDYGGNAFGDRGYQWTNGQTGSLTMTTFGTYNRVRIVYRTYASGSTVTVNDGSTQVGSFSTAGTANRYGFADVAYTSGNTLTINKSTSSGAAAIAAVIPLAGNNGLYFGRLCQNGSSIAPNIAAKSAELQSYLAACGCELVLWETANESPPDSGTTHEAEGYLPTTDAAFTALTPSGGALVLVDLFGYAGGGFSTSSDDWGSLAPAALGDWSAQKLALIDTGYFSTTPGWISGLHRMGEWQCWPLMFEAGGFATQTDDGTTRAVTDMHTSATGGSMVGQAIANILVDAVNDTQTSPTVDDIRIALGLGSANLDTQLASLNTAVGLRPTLSQIQAGFTQDTNPNAPTQDDSIIGEVKIAIGDAALVAGQTEDKVDTLTARIGTPSSGDLAANVEALPTNAQLQASLAALETTAVDTVRVSDARTWHLSRKGAEYDSDKIVTVNAGFDGTLAFDLTNGLNPDNTINTVTSVTIGDGTQATSNLRLRTNRREVMFDTPALVAGTYTVTCVVTTTDSQSLPITGTLIVK